MFVTSGSELGLSFVNEEVESVVIHLRNVDARILHDILVVARQDPAHDTWEVAVIDDLENALAGHFS